MRHVQVYAAVHCICNVTFPNTAGTIQYYISYVPTPATECYISCVPTPATTSVAALQEEIVDETDTFVDNERTMKVNASVLALTLPPRLRPMLASWRANSFDRRPHSHEEPSALVSQPSK